MRIGIDATTIYTSRPTGLGVYTINMVNELARLHDDLVVWTVDDSQLRLEKSKVRKVLQPFKFLGNSLFQLRPLWVEAAFAGAIRREGVDVLYSTIPNGIVSSPVPHVVTVHDLIPLTFPADAPRSVSWNFRHRLPRIFANASRVVAVSEFTRRDLLRMYELDPLKVVTVSEGYDRDHFAPRPDPATLFSYGLRDKGYILYVGSSSPRKNLPLLIEAFALVQNRIPHDLVLAGPKSDGEMNRLKELIGRFRVTDRVKLVNYLPYRDLPALYSGAALFAFLSCYEGFGLPVLEAMACGTPVLAADATSLPEVVGDAALLVAPEVNGVASALAALMAAPGELNRLRQAGLERCSNFRWEESARSVLSIVKEH